MKAWAAKNKVFLIVAALSLLFIPSIVSPREGATDTAQYIMLSRSILDGQFYPETRFPPLFPLMLTPLVYFFGYNLLAMQLMIVAFAVLSLFACYCLIKHHANETIALTVLVLIGTSPLFIDNVMVLSDVPFFLFTVTWALLLSRYHKATSYNGMTLTLGLAFALLAFFSKAVGAAVIIATVGYLLYVAILRQAPWRQILPGILFIVVPVGLWVYYRGVIPQGYLQSSLSRELYSPELGSMTWKELIIHRMSAAKDAAFFVAKTALYDYDLSILGSLRGATAPIIILVLLLGYVRRHLRRVAVAEYFLVSYIGVAVAFGRADVIRQYLPILPFAAYYLTVGTKTLSSRILPQRLAGLAFAGAIALVLLSNLAFNVREMSRPASADWVDFKKAVRWTGDNSSSDSIVMSRQHEWVTMLAGREAWPYAYSTDSAKVLEPIRKGEVDYVIVDSFKWTETTKRYLVPAIRSDMERFEPVYQAGETIVYKVKE